MSFSRVLGLLAGLTLIALALVHLRAEQVRCAARIAHLESQWAAGRQELWTVLARSSRLRSPRRMHERMEYLNTQLVAPDRQEPPVRLARHHPAPTNDPGPY